MHVCLHASNTREMTPKLDFNTKILLTSRIMHRFQRFLVFWKAEGLLFHLETTFPHCFVFVRSKTGHLWKVCLIYWTNAGSSIPDYLKMEKISNQKYRWKYLSNRNALFTVHGNTLKHHSYHFIRLSEQYCVFRGMRNVAYWLSCWGYWTSVTCIVAVMMASFPPSWC